MQESFDRQFPTVFAKVERFRPTRIKIFRQKRNYDPFFWCTEFNQFCARFVRMTTLLKKTVSSWTVFPAIDADLGSFATVIGYAGVHRVVAVKINPLDSQLVAQSSYG